MNLLAIIAPTIIAQTHSGGFSNLLTPSISKYIIIKYQASHHNLGIFNIQTAVATSSSFFSILKLVSVACSIVYTRTYPFTYSATTEITMILPTN
jgi:hypothetical protein